MKSRRKSKLQKKANRGFRGYPVATVAFYGPDDTHATKVAVSIIPRENSSAEFLERWLSDKGDVRKDDNVGAEVLAFIESHGAKTVVMADRIIGCPHEEVIDYPKRRNLSEMSLLGQPRPLEG